MKNMSPLSKLLTAINFIVTVLSFSSLVENGFSDLLKWVGFVGQVIESYRSISRPVFDVLLFWSPETLRQMLGDYLLAGILLVSGARLSGSTIFLLIMTPFAANQKPGYVWLKNNVFRGDDMLTLQIASVVVVSITWPAVVLLILKFYVTRVFIPNFHESDATTTDFEFEVPSGQIRTVKREETFEILEMLKRHVLLGILQWVAALLLGFVILLVINANLPAN